MTRYNDIRKISFTSLLMLGGFLLCQNTIASTENSYSTNLSGTTGLNNTPTARMQKNGRITIGAGTLDPFLHSYIGMQIAQPLEIVLRQSAQTSSLRTGSYALDPGADIKLRLLEESDHAPAIAAGMQSALGDKTMRIPYVVISKRYNGFDFTLGKGWGRYDENYGIFGGIEYFLPIKGLSAKLDYTPQSYADEERGTGYHAPSPVGFGINYTHKSGITGALGIQGADKIFARLSYNFSPAEWKLNKTHPPQTEFYTQRPEETDAGDIPLQAKNEGLYITAADFSKDKAIARVTLNNTHPAALQIGRTARIIAQNSPPDIENITITTDHQGFEGTSITFQRKDLERAFASKTLSPQELWHNTKFSREAHMRQSIQARKFPIEVKLEQNVDFSTHHEGIFHRNAIVAQAESTILNSGFLSQIGLRFNLFDNLDETYGRYIAENTSPVRSDINLFAQRKITLDTAFISYAHSFSPDIHVLASVGYLDEQYAGVGAQILYRPFTSRYALGGQLWHGIKRSPYTFMNAGTLNESRNVALIEGWYELPYYDVTLHAQAGRFLAGDNGAVLGLEKTFKNGSILSGSIAVSDEKAIDVTGNDTRTIQKLNLKIPLGGFRFIPDGSSAELNAGSFGDDIVQNIRPPIDLYEATTPLGIKSLSESWALVTE